MRHVEQQTHKAILKYINVKYPRALCFHPANEGKRSRVTGAILKSMGMLAGTPDLCVLWNDGERGRVGFIEVKSPKGVLQPSQKTFAENCLRLKINWAIARSVNDAELVLKTWGMK